MNPSGDDLGQRSRPQFRLRSLFVLTALVAVGCLVGPPIVREVAMAWEVQGFRFDNHDRLAATALLFIGFWLVANRRTFDRRPSKE